MKVNQLEERVKSMDELVDMQFENPNTIDGKIIAPTQAMSTVLGKRVHLIHPKSTATTVFAICGAGLPNKQFPQGSAIVIPNARDENSDGEASGVIMDCYKCLKVLYMNDLKRQGIEVPVRTFDPSNQQPDPSKWGVEIPFENISTIDWRDVKYVMQKGDLFIYFSKYKDKGKRYRMHSIVPEDQIVNVIEYIGKQGISVTSKPKADISVYDSRRKQHIMLPMGRYGIFGSNSANAKVTIDGEYDEVTPQNYLQELYPQFDDIEEMDFDFSWVNEYFDPKNGNQWRVGAKPRRRTQQERKSSRPFETTSLDLAGVRFKERLTNKEKDRIFFIESKIEQYRNFLQKIPIVSLYKILQKPPKSVTSKRVLKIVEQEREEELNKYRNSLIERSSRKKNNPRSDRVLPMLEQLSSLDKMFVTLENEHAENQRRGHGSRRKSKR